MMMLKAGTEMLRPQAPGTNPMLSIMQGAGAGIDYGEQLKGRDAAQQSAMQQAIMERVQLQQERDIANQKEVGSDTRNRRDNITQATNNFARNNLDMGKAGVQLFQDLMDKSATHNSPGNDPFGMPLPGSPDLEWVNSEFQRQLPMLQGMNVPGQMNPIKPRWEESDIASLGDMLYGEQDHEKRLSLLSAFLSERGIPPTGLEAQRFGQALQANMDQRAPQPMPEEVAPQRSGVTTRGAEKQAEASLPKAEQKLMVGQYNQMRREADTMSPSAARFALQRLDAIEQAGALRPTENYRIRQLRTKLNAIANQQ
jgi:hypothetical protein